MKKIILVLTILTMNSVTWASLPKAHEVWLAGCYGDHHGSSLDFRTTTQPDGQVDLWIEVSTDSGISRPAYKVWKFDKDAVAVPTGLWGETLLEAIEMNEDKSAYTEFVFIKATDPAGSEMILNLNKWNGQNFLVIDGYVEPLTCSTSRAP